jgi:hypothetical protein
MSKAKITYIMDDRFATRIINKYREGPHTKSAILACQKELIDNDLIQNAGW